VDGRLRKGNLFIISGPSGAGKGTLVKEILSRVPDAWLSVSATTRSMRPGEVEGISYSYVSYEQFQTLIDTGGLLEYSKHFSNYYGTPKAPVEEHIAAGKQVILEIDVNGARQVQEITPYAVTIFVEPPSVAELKSRLIKRGTESPEQIEERINRVNGELEHKARYNYTVVNDDLSQACDELAAIIDSHARIIKE